MVKVHRKYTIEISEYIIDDVHKFKTWKTAIKTTYIEASETSQTVCEHVEWSVLYVIELCALRTNTTFVISRYFHSL